MTQNFQRDLVRIIGQHLSNLGLKRTVEVLLQESGVHDIDHPEADRFFEDVLAGKWETVNSCIEKIASYSEGDKKAIANELKLLVAEQKFLEYLEEGQHLKALKCLRTEITPIISVDPKQVQKFAILLVCKSGEVKTRANWPGLGAASRLYLVEQLSAKLPPIIVLPPKRLHTLIYQAVQLQRERCPLHIGNNEMGNMTGVDLKKDHVCSSENFPLKCIQGIDSHKTEVWFCKFSNDGLMLATGGLGGKVKIWDVDHTSHSIEERCTLDCNSYSITCLSWSPNDNYLMACGCEERPDLWIWNVHKEEVQSMINHTEEESITTCSWHLSGEKYATASIKGNFNIYDLDGNKCGSREGVRVQCLLFPNKDPNVILAADTLNRIKAYAIKDMSLDTDEEDILEEKHPITSFTMDRKDRYIAVNLIEQGVHLWDYKHKTLLRMFPGVCQRNLTLYSSFSSPKLSKNSTFLASGSEDGKVYIYNVNKDQPVAILHGHSRCVNCVTWNPVYPELLVSVSDDRFVRIWGPTNSEITNDVWEK